MKTRRWWLLNALAFALVLAGLVLRRGELIAMALPLLLFSAAGVARPLTVQLIIRRQLSADHCLGGQPVTVLLEIVNEGPAAIVAYIRDLLPAGVRIHTGQAELTTALKPGGKARVEYQVTASRGLFRFESVYVHTQDSLGLNSWEQELSCPARLAVLPDAEELSASDLEIRPRRTRIFAGTIPARAGGVGLAYFGSRPYQSGDALRWINWKATARRNEPITNEFEQERAADVGIILDARRSADVCANGSSLFEHSVKAALSLANYFIRTGNRVGLLRYGEHLDWTAPGFGRQQQEKILEELIDAQQGDSVVFKELENLPVWLFPTQSQLVLVSPVLRGDVEFIRYLRAREYRVLVVSPDPIAFELSGQLVEGDSALAMAMRIARLQRRATLDKLRRAGVRVVDWNLHEPLARALRRARRELR